MARRDDDTSPLADVECYDLAEELADRMELDPKQRARFIDECMTRSGYEATQSRDAYSRASKDNEREEDGRWGFGNSGARRGGNQRQSSRRDNRRNAPEYDPDKF